MRNCIDSSVTDNNTLTTGISWQRQTHNKTNIQSTKSNYFFADQSNNRDV